jgi:hypothetical protein
MDDKQKKTLKTSLVVVGSILISIFIINRITGLYPSDLPLYLILAIAGIACLIASQKIKIVKPGEDRDGLMIAGKWKCACGTYNDKSNTFCGNCGAKRPIPPAQ